MIARTLAAAVVLCGAPALSQERFLRAPQVECAALEALVVFGLIDGGPGGDTAELSALVDSGDVGACTLGLEAHGYGEGLLDESCFGAMELMAVHGPPAPAADPASLLYDVLTGASLEACEMVLRHFDR